MGGPRGLFGGRIGGQMGMAPMQRQIQGSNQPFFGQMGMAPMQQFRQPPIGGGFQTQGSGSLSDFLPGGRFWSGRQPGGLGGPEGEAAARVAFENQRPGQGLGGQGFQGLQGLQERLAALQNQQLGASQQLNPGFSNMRYTGTQQLEQLNRQRADEMQREMYEKMQLERPELGQGIGGGAPWENIRSTMPVPPPRPISGDEELANLRTHDMGLEETLRRQRGELLGQGIGGREDIALPGTGQTQPPPMYSRLPVPAPGMMWSTKDFAPPDRRQVDPGFYMRPEDRMRRPDEEPQLSAPTPPPMQTTMPVPPKPPGTATQIGAPPLTPSKPPPGTGGIKPAPPPASTPPPPGQIGIPPRELPSGQIGGPAPVNQFEPYDPPEQRELPPGQIGGPAPTAPQIPAPPQIPTPPQQPAPYGPDDESNMMAPPPIEEIQEEVVEEVPFDPSGPSNWGFQPQPPPWGRQQPFPFLPPMMPRFGGGMPRGMGMPYGGGGPYGNLWGGGGGGFGGGYGRRQMPPMFGGGFGGGMGGGYGGGMGGIGGFPGMGGGGYGGGFGGGYGMPQMPRFGGGFGGGMGGGFGGGIPLLHGGMGSGYGGGVGGGMPNYGMDQLFGGGMRQPQNQWLGGGW